MTTNQPSLIKEIRNNWVLIIFIGSLIVGWTNLSNRIAANETMAQENKTSLEAIIQIQIDLATIKKDVEFIKLQVK